VPSSAITGGRYPRRSTVEVGQGGPGRQDANRTGPPGSVGRAGVHFGGKRRAKATVSDRPSAGTDQDPGSASAAAWQFELAGGSEDRIPVAAAVGDSMSRLRAGGLLGAVNVWGHWTVLFWAAKIRKAER